MRSESVCGNLTANPSILVNLCFGSAKRGALVQVGEEPTLRNFWVTKEVIPEPLQQRARLGLFGKGFGFSL